MSNFLPEDYENPSQSSGYLRLEQGENRIRILSKPIFGWEDWTADKKPVRHRLDCKPDKSIDPERPIRHFWAMIAWNYAKSCVQIWQITQASIQKQIEELYEDKDWGSPFEYDIKVVKSGEKMKTKYNINPAPRSALDPAIIASYKAAPIYLDALYENLDPWQMGASGSYTKAYFQEAETNGFAKATPPVQIQPAGQRSPIKILETEIIMNHGPSVDVSGVAAYLARLSADAKGKVSPETIASQAAYNGDMVNRFFAGYQKWQEAELAIPF